MWVLPCHMTFWTGHWERHWRNHMKNAVNMPANSSCLGVTVDSSVKGRNNLSQLYYIGDENISISFYFLDLNCKARCSCQKKKLAWLLILLTIIVFLLVQITWSNVWTSNFKSNKIWIDFIKHFHLASLLTHFLTCLKWTYFYYCVYYKIWFLTSIFFFYLTNQLDINSGTLI